jgi:membrane protease YdiL (CAAX protease family)
MNLEKKDLLRFALAVIVTTTLIVSCFRLFHITSNWAANVLMFVPGLVAALLLLRRREGFRSIGWGVGPWRYWLAAIILPTLVILVAIALSLRFGYIAPAPASTPAGSLIVHPAKLLKNMLIYLVISLPLAFGEEFGWRGYAQNRLIRQFGIVGGLLLLGLIWGFWHTPIYYVMHEYPQHPFFGPFVMTPIDNILVVVPMAWLYLRSRSIWVATFTHAFADILWGFSGLMFPATHEIQNWVVLQIVQAIVSAVLLIDLLSNRQRSFEPSLRESSASA